jgi:hypothetical protein
MNIVTTFGVDPSDTQPQRSSLYGASGWWTVPTQYYVWTDANHQVWCSPNENHEPAFACKTDYDFTLKYFDLYRNRQLGIA